MKDTAKTGKSLVIKGFEEAGGKVPEGKVFVEWSTEPNGGGVHYKPGKVVRMYDSFALYPVFADAEGSK